MRGNDVIPGHRRPHSRESGNPGVMNPETRDHPSRETALDIRDGHTKHACGWHRIATGCEILLGYVIDETEWGREKIPAATASPTRPDAVRGEVLARLPALNAERAEAERATGGV